MSSRWFAAARPISSAQSPLPLPFDDVIGVEESRGGGCWADLSLQSK
jgi:hypothetical protein